MDLPRALGQLADIHQQLAKGEIYRGYRSVPGRRIGTDRICGGVGAGARRSAPPIRLGSSCTGPLSRACAALVGRQRDHLQLHP